MDNIEKKIHKHNTKILKVDPENTQHNNKVNCNCRDKASCPVPGKCCTANVIYEATCNSNGTKTTYIGSTSNTFKTRYNQHTHSFRHENKKSSTSLSQYVWTKGIASQAISWRILQVCSPYMPGNKSCQLKLEYIFI